MMIAIAPAIRKKTNDWIRYMYPITLWSVEVIHRTMVRPSLGLVRGS